MKKAALVFWLFVVGFFFPFGVTRAQEDVLGITQGVMPTPLPRVVTGQNVFLKETINNDLVVLGGTVTVSSVVGENLLAAGGEVKLSGKVRGNVIVAGGNLVIDQGAEIGGYLLAAGGEVTLEGKVNGDVRLIGGQIDVRDGSVLAGSLLIDGKDLKISDKARVAGKKTITEISANQKMPWGYWRGIAGKGSTGGPLRGILTVMKVIGFLGQIVLILILAKLFGRHIGEMTRQAERSFLSTFGLGVAKFFLTPLLVILLFVSVIGIPLAVIFLGLYFGGIFISSYLTALVLGRWFGQKGWIKKNIYIQSAAGLVALEAAGFVPVIGVLVRLLALFVGLGLVVNWEKSLLFAKKLKD